MLVGFYGDNNTEEMVSQTGSESSVLITDLSTLASKGDFVALSLIEFRC